MSKNLKEEAFVFSNIEPQSSFCGLARFSKGNFKHGDLVRLSGAEAAKH